MVWCVYRLNSSNGLVYFGSTTQELRFRLTHHKTMAKNIEKAPRSHLLFADGATVTINSAEDLPDCTDKYELEARERWHIEHNECVNKNLPGRTREEWREENKEHVLEQKRGHYQKNRQRLLEQQKKNRAKQIEKITEYQKGFYQDNKERINARNRANYQANRDRILKQKKEKVTCECGAVIARGDITKHRKSDKHAKIMLEINNTNNERQNLQATVQQEALATTESVEQPEGYSST